MGEVVVRTSLLWVAGLSAVVFAVAVAVAACRGMQPATPLMMTVTTRSVIAATSLPRTAVPSATAATPQASNAALRSVYTRPAKLWPKPWLDPGIAASELAPLPAMPYPTRNPSFQPKETLGRLLFFDPRLSGSGQIACASCHDPQLGWADGKRLSIGFARSEGVMNAPSIANSGYEQSLFWDGRAASLEEQIPGSLRNPVEMNTHVARATARIAAIRAYRPFVVAAFGDARVNWQRLCDAIATYVRSIQLRDTPFDRFLQGDTQALSDSAVRGLHLFRTKARCMNCHSGALLSDGQYHHLSTSFYGVGNFEGRYAVTHDSADMGRFRTPGLRGAAHTGPWMHNGLINDLDGLLALYNMGWWQNSKPDPAIADTAFAQLDRRIRPLHLGLQELADLKSFLLSLSAPPQYQPQPRLPGLARKE